MNVSGIRRSLRQNIDKDIDLKKLFYKIKRFQQYTMMQEFSNIPDLPAGGF